MNFFVKIVFCLLLIILTQVEVFSSWEITPFSNVDFFPQNIVNAITQDQQGNIWLGTWGQGVWQLNESGSIHYEPLLYHYDDCINTLTFDNDGNLWAGTSKGWTRFDGIDWHNGTVDNLSNSPVKSFASLHDGRFLAGVPGNLYQVEVQRQQGRQQIEWLPLLDETQSDGNNIDHIFQRQNGELWVSINRHGLFRYADDEWTQYDWHSTFPITFVESNEGQFWAIGGEHWLLWQDEQWVQQDHIPMSHMTCAVLLDDQYWMVGTEQGLWTNTDGEWKRVTLQQDNTQLQIECIFPQDQQTVWVGSRVGVFRLSQSSWKRHFETSDWNHQTFAAAKDHPAVIFTDEGQLYQFDGNSFEVQTASLGDWGDIHDAIYTNDSLWVLCALGLLQLDQAYEVIDEIALPEDFTGTRLLQDGLNRVWIYSERSVYLLTPEKTIQTVLNLPDQFQRHIMTLCWIEGDEFWLGMDLGLAKLSQGAFAWFEEIAPLNDRKIRAIHQDHLGRWWFGTSVAGVFVWQANEGWKQYSTRNGLSNNFVSTIYESTNQTIWVGSRNGHLSSYQNERWIQHNQIYDIELNQISEIIESSDETTWFYAENSGLTSYQPKPNAPNTFFNMSPKEIDFNSQGIFSVKGIDSWNQTPVGLLEYSWRILDDIGDVVQPWSRLSRNTVFTIPILAPGEYTLEARSEDMDRNVDPTPVRATFVVTPPMWQRAEFYMPVGVLVAVVLFLSWKRYKAKLALIESENKYRTLVENAQTLILKRKVDGTVTFWSECGTHLLGIDPETIQQAHVKDSIFKNSKKLPPCLQQSWGDDTHEYLCGYQCESLVRDTRGNDVWIAWNCQPILEHNGTIKELLKIGVDVTQRKSAEIIRDQVIEDLTNAINEVKTLSGLLPICSACKKIRDDQGYWNMLEEYIIKHSHAQFSHGICPDCAKLLYPEHYRDSDMS